MFDTLLNDESLPALRLQASRAAGAFEIFVQKARGFVFLTLQREIRFPISVNSYGIIRGNHKE